MRKAEPVEERMLRFNWNVGPMTCSQRGQTLSVGRRCLYFILHEAKHVCDPRWDVVSCTGSAGHQWRQRVE